MSSTATTNTLDITVAVSNVEISSPITTAAILDAVKGTVEKKQQVKQLKNKMEKTKKSLIENTTLSFTTVNEIYSQVTLLMQAAISPENTPSEKELSCSVENFVNCIETTCGSIEKSVAVLKKLKQKMVQTNKTYVEQTNLLASLPEESTPAPPAKKPRAKKVKETNESQPTEESSTEPVATKTKKPRAKKVKESNEPQPTEESQQESPVVESSTEPVATKTKKPRAKKVKESNEPQPTEEPQQESPVVEPSAEPVAENPKKPRAKKVKSTTTETLLDKPEIDVSITAEEQSQTNIKYTVIYPEETVQIVQEPVEQKSKKPKQPKQSKKKSELPSTPVVNDIDSITAEIEPSAPIKQNHTRESIISDIPEDDFVPKHLTFDYEINSQDFCKELDMITDELEEDIISEITEWIV